MTKPLRMRRLGLLASVVAAALAGVAPAAATESAARATVPMPTLQEAIASPADLYARAALTAEDGPTYEMLAPVLPPLRYVDAPFRHYPIVLSAPAARVKGRLVSNGSSVNALARQPNWRGEAGTPVAFRVGAERVVFGEDLRRLEGPTYEGGYLPLVHLSYRHAGATYALECFAATDEALAARGAMFVKFTLTGGESGRVEAQVEGSTPYVGRGGAVRNAGGKTLVSFEPSRWTFNPARNTLTTELARGHSAALLVYTQPADAPVHVEPATYDAARGRCLSAWRELLARGTQVEVPEPLVNNACRSLLAGCFALASGDEIRYSAGNQYAKLYIGEGTDALRALLLLGYRDDARRMLVPLFDHTRKGLEFHQAAFKLQALAHYYQLTRDGRFLRDQRHRWEKELNLLLSGREKETGLLPREKYCGDIDTRVYSLNSNANAWRALRDMSVVLHDLGENDEAAALEVTAADFRSAVLAALEKSVDRSTVPPFVPVALSGEEKPYETVTASRMGSYWNIMSCYVLGSGVFPPDSQTASDLIRYVQDRRGRFVGLNRAFHQTTWWASADGINDLYGLRYALALLRRDEADLALVGFYGKLAHGLTRDTFIGAEGSNLRPVDEFGRQFYLPPNSASNASFLWQLRCLLVQDWDLDDDGRPETLRLAFATPRPWLRDGCRIRVEGAPTAFGDVSFALESRLSQGKIDGRLALPETAPRRTLLRLRLPRGWKISSAASGSRALALVDHETIDVTGLAGAVEFRASVAPKRQ